MNLYSKINKSHHLIYLDGGPEQKVTVEFQEEDVIKGEKLSPEEFKRQEEKMAKKEEALKELDKYLADAKDQAVKAHQLASSKFFDTFRSKESVKSRKIQEAYAKYTKEAERSGSDEAKEQWVEKQKALIAHVLGPIMQRLQTPPIIKDSKGQGYPDYATVAKELGASSVEAGVLTHHLNLHTIKKSVAYHAFNNVIPDVDHKQFDEVYNKLNNLHGMTA